MNRRRARYIWQIVRRGPVETGYAFFRALRRRRNVADEQPPLLPSDRLALASYFDVEADDLAANAELLRAYDELDELDVRSIQWFIPGLHFVYAGGIHTILRFADHLLRRHGVKSRFNVFTWPDLAPVQDLRTRVGEAFPALADASFTPAGAELPPSDSAIATAWESAYPLLRFRRARSKFFFVQDWEPDFHPAGSATALLGEAARFGFPGIVNTPALADVYRSHGNRAISFVPGVDERFRPGERRSDGPVRIVFYGRIKVARNAFGLGVTALRRVKKAYGDRVEIVSAGEDWSPGQFGAGDVLENVGILESLDEVADLYRSCDIGLVFMLSKHPSYQPLEYMASGVATVSNLNPYTGWLLRHEDNALLSEPVPALVAEQIGRLVEDRELRERIVRGGLETVGKVSWEEQFERVFAAMTKRGERFDERPETDVAAVAPTAAPRFAAPRG